LETQPKKYLFKIPIGLIYSRLIVGLVILLFAYFQIASFNYIITLLIVIGLLTDIFDGIIARKLNVSNRKLRRMDSSVDQVFWICCLIGAYMICPQFFKANSVKLIIILVVETLTYVVSFLRFRKEVATHAIMSKVWTLFLMAAIIQVILSCNSYVLFELCFYVGIISRLEIVAILFILKNWTNDVPSIYHAVLIRQGKEIKRHKLLNG
jgi:CDP-diacylglycerol--glycerol-3-phosphate 3-phosphatidyltransferase